MIISWQDLDLGKKPLHPDVFQDLCHRWGTPEVDFGFNNKLVRFVSMYKEPLVEAVDALMAP